MPASPDVPPDQRTSGAAHLRYEDVTQDGRVQLSAFPSALGLIWRELIRAHEIESVRLQGVVPILSRVYAAGGSEPVSVGPPLRAEGGFALAHHVGAGGEVERLLLNIWVNVSGAKGRTHPPPPADAGSIVPVGRVFAEHIFTRPFAPSDQRRVTRLEIDGLPPVPPDRYLLRPPSAAMELPPDAQPLDEALVVDPQPVVFGLMHTDSNQHVNSLVYPRLFQEAALRHLARGGRKPVLLARECEIAYRKPCFAGDTVRVALRAFVWRERVGVIGCFVDEADAATPAALAAARPRTFARLVFA